MLSDIKPLNEAKETHGTTNEAAHWLRRKPGTLRAWANNNTGPIKPIRVGGRLAWPVAEIKRVMGVA